MHHMVRKFHLSSKKEVSKTQTPPLPQMQPSSAYKSWTLYCKNSHCLINFPCNLVAKIYGMITACCVENLRDKTNSWCCMEDRITFLFFMWPLPLFLWQYPRHRHLLDLECCPRERINFDLFLQELILPHHISVCFGWQGLGNNELKMCTTRRMVHLVYMIAQQICFQWTPATFLGILF